MGLGRWAGVEGFMGECMCNGTCRKGNGWGWESEGGRIEKA